VAGGMENMTRAPYLLPSGRFGARMGDAELIDSMVHDGLWDAFNDIHMGITAENLADQYGISREEQDAVRRRQPAEGRACGRRRDLQRRDSADRGARKGGTRMVDSDEHPRAGTTAEALAKLRAAFRRDGGTVTAGNASGINDGAAAIVVMSASKANERGLRTFGTVESYASVGVEPKIMGIGPVPAVRKALARAGLELGDIDLFELNEAFAAQSLAVLRELEIDPERINPMAGRSRSGTRSGPAAAGSSSRSCTRCAAATQGAASRRSASAAAKGRPRSSATAPRARAAGARASAAGLGRTPTPGGRGLRSRSIGRARGRRRHHAAACPKRRSPRAATGAAATSRAARAGRCRRDRRFCLRPSSRRLARCCAHNVCPPNSRCASSLSSPTSPTLISASWSAACTSLRSACCER
jgi:hypothetical protein